MIVDKDIALFEAALDSKTCQEVIDFFERSYQENRVYDRRNDFLMPDKENSKEEMEKVKMRNGLKKDSSVNLSLETDLAREILKVLWDCWQEVLTHYCYDGEPNNHIHSLKIQKTLPGEGYHVWHVENMGGSQISRVATWSIYLNDVFEGGETEFLMQSKRFSPRSGDILIWPAHYTHPHRGNPPLEEVKYILTGWILQQ